MQKFLIFLTSVAITTSLFAQQPSNEISSDAINFIKTTFHDKRDNIYLSIQNVNDYMLKEMKESLLKDVISIKRTYETGIVIIDTLLVLNEIEKKFIDSSLNVYQQYKWTEKIVKQFELPNLRLANPDTVSVRGLPIRYCIMPPIFIKDNSICIFYSDWYYPGMPLGGEGSLNLYKRENGVWKYLFTVYGWRS